MIDNEVLEELEDMGVVDPVELDDDNTLDMWVKSTLDSIDCIAALEIKDNGEVCDIILEIKENLKEDNCIVTLEICGESKEFTSMEDWTAVCKECVRQHIAEHLE